MQVEEMRKRREHLGLPSDGTRGPEAVEVAAGVHAVTKRQLTGLVEHCAQRYEAKRMDPGKCCMDCTSLS